MYGVDLLLVFETEVEQLDLGFKCADLVLLHVEVDVCDLKQTRELLVFLGEPRDLGLG